jgi:SAM-dependent methyltransferase
MAIDYDEASTTYDRTRGTDEAIIERMAARGAFAPREGRRARVLDFGCGTGNYLERITCLIGLGRLPGCELFGLEPSEGMRSKAIAKNPGLRVLRGDHGELPFERRYFDFVYMTDVIHHVPDLDLLFEGLFSRLAPGGIVCVATESWSQIEARWYNVFFPSLAENEKARYPDIDEIAHRAVMAGFRLVDVETEPNPGPYRVDAAFLALVREKGYSMFRLLGEAEYERGYRTIREAALAGGGGPFSSPGAGASIVWLAKGGK